MSKLSITPLSRRLLTGALLTALAMPVFAQSTTAPDQAPTRSQRADAPHGGPAGHGPRQGHEGNRGFERLNLTEAQRDQMFTIRHQAEPALHENRKAMRAAHESLRTLQRADTLDTQALKRATDAIGAAAAERARLTTLRDHALYQVLTPAQRSELSAAREDGPRGEGRHGGAPRHHAQR